MSTLKMSFFEVPWHVFVDYKVGGFYMEYMLVLGAGLMQKPAIEAAKRLGFHAVVVDANPKAVCVPLADTFKQVDLKDKDAIAALACELAAKGTLAGIFTAGTDFSASVAYAAEKAGGELRRHVHGYEACLNASIKTRMRECFKKAGVPCPDYTDITVQNASQAVAALKAQDFPMVIKPVDNMGGRGCRMVRTPDEAGSAVQAAVAASRSGHAILETYMDGPEYSIDSLVYNGTMTITGFADRHIKYPPYFIEVGHTMPTDIDRQQYLELVSAFALGVKALGLTDGAAKADIKYTKNGPMIGEIAARLSGGYMSGWTYPYASGCNLTEQAVCIACGKTPEYLERNRRPLPYTPPESCRSQPAPFELYDLECTCTSAERAWISIPGKVAAVIGLGDAEKIAGVKNVLPRVAAGDTVTFPHNNVEKCGNVITVAGDRSSAVAAAEQAVRTITVRLQGGNAETERFLDGVPQESERGFPPSAYTVADGWSCGPDEVIGAGVPTAAKLPASLASCTERDWNYCTVAETARRFDALCPDHKELPAARFWKWVVRGGIQGALYAADTL